MLNSGLPALPVVDADGRSWASSASASSWPRCFRATSVSSSYAGFIKHGLDDAIERRIGCRSESVSGYMNTEHIAVGEDFSDVQLAETFLHHRVLSSRSPTPAVSAGHHASRFFRRLGERFLEHP